MGGAGNGPLLRAHVLVREADHVRSPRHGAFRRGQLPAHAGAADGRPRCRAGCGAKRADRAVRRKRPGPVGALRRDISRPRDGPGAVGRGGRRRQDDLVGQPQRVPGCDREQLGRRDADGAVRAKSGRQPRVRRLVGADAAVGGEPGNGASADGDDHADRPAGGAADDPGADAGDPHAGRSHRAGGGGPGRGCADPRCAVHRLSRQGRVRLGPDAGARRHRGVPHGPPRLPAARGRSGPGHRPVHRHRRLHGARVTARRRSLAGPPGRAQPHRARRAGELARDRDQNDRRRLPGDVRRPCPGSQLRRGDRRLTRRPEPADPRGCAHGRVRAARRRRRGDRRAHRGARDGACGPGEVLASSTVKDLVFGSGLRFSDRGVHSLRGVPDEWRLFALER